MTRTRRLPLWLPALALLCALVAVVQAREMVSVSQGEIHMRKGPGTSHEPLWLLGRGYPLEVTGRRGNWYQVRDFERDQGWVYRSLVGRTPHHVVKVPVANVRARPSAGSRIIGQAVYGAVLRTVEKREQWVRVRQDNGAKGWISRRLLWGW